MDQITGTIETISRTYNGGWRFASVPPHGTVVGHLPDELRPGDFCLFKGRWKEHQKYGRQFHADDAQVEIPKDVRGIRDYLDRHFKYVGPAIARRLIDAFGEQLFDVIEHDHLKLESIQGITPARALEIHDEYLKVKNDRTHDVFFATHGITLGMRNRLVDQYGSKANAIEAIKQNPYALADSVWGVGFKSADKIALSMGIPKDDPQRLNAGVRWVLQESSQGEGHCYLPAEELLKRCREILEVGEDDIKSSINRSILSGHLTSFGGAVYRTDLLKMEQAVGAKLFALASSHHERMMQEISQEIVAGMDEDQRRALNLALSSKVVVITGGPGCLSGDTLIKVSRRSSKNTPTTYTLRDIYHKFKGIKQTANGHSTGGKNKMWDRSKLTMMLSMKEENTLIYNTVIDMIHSGVKPVYRVTTESGKNIKATQDHPFRVSPGTNGEDEEHFKLLKDLIVGDFVLCEYGEYGSNGKQKMKRKVVHCIPYHPHAASLRRGNKNRDYKRCFYARLVVEAKMNNLDMEDFLFFLRNDYEVARKLEFLPKSKEVHHKDGNQLNDDISNLDVLDKEDHLSLHGNGNAKNFGNNIAKPERIVSIEYVGEEDTYDVVMDEPFRNLVAQGFVVHNCGKTYTINRIIQALGDADIRLAAPTGKAAKRMSEMSGIPAETIHRLLAFHPEFGFTINARNPLTCNTLIIDETSMLDLSLMYHLMDAVKDQQIIFVGDVNQLPSVGPGAVLKDMIESGKIPVAYLKTLHRQAAASSININAQRINGGQKLQIDKEKRDLVFIQEDDPQIISTRIMGICQKIPESTQFNTDDIQVLCPQKRGPIGTENLNTLLRPVLNPTGLTLDGVPFNKGDRVIQTRNNYKLMIFNGDIGRVVGSDKDYLYVDIDGNEIPYPLSDLSDLKPAYALTVHKCVSGETLVETQNGLMSIQNIPFEGIIASHDGAKSYSGWIANEHSKLLTITTEDGFKITTTPEHGMDVWDGEGYSKRKTENIRHGDFLRLKLGAVLDRSDLVRTPASSNGDVREITFNVPLYVNEDLAEFLGLFVADGILFRGGFRLGKRHKEVAGRFAELCKRLFDVDAKRYKKENTYFTEVSSTFLSRWVSAIGGTLSNRKSIPDCILQSSLRVQSRFLRGLFEDGSVHLKDGKLDHIELSNKFQGLIDTTRIMLLRFGIISGTTTAGQPNIQIYGCNAKKFATKVGFISECKNSRLVLSAGKETRYVAPISKKEAWALYSEDRVGFGKFNYQNSRDRGYISREQLKKISVNYSGALQELIDSKLSFHHSRVKCIKESEGPSFCVEVPDGHQFLQNGFCAFNSQGSEFPVVIMPIHTTNYLMLRRNLIYTGITRGKKLVILVGTMKAVNTAIRTVDASTRFTSLSRWIREGEIT